MILDGAPVIVDPEQAVEIVSGLLGDQGFAFGELVSRHERALNLDSELRCIYDAVTEECTVDEVALNAGLPAARVATGLADLELDGLVSSLDGRWRRT